MGFDFWDHKSWEVNYSWLHGPEDERLLGTKELMIAGSVLYLLVMAVFSIAMKSRREAKPPRPLWITPLVLIQNFIMAVYSFYVFWGATLVLIENSRKPGFKFSDIYCDPKHTFNKGMDFWMYHFYLSKFFEWFDTIFLILRAKPVFPPSSSQFFLHVFHHFVTPSIVWFAWRTPFSAAWIGPVSNGFVHVFMYSYYFLTELGMNRRYGGMLITPIQLIQFVIALSLIGYETLFTAACDSDQIAVYWMNFTYAIFLILFIKLYFDKKTERAKPDTSAAAKTDKKKK